MKGKCGKCGSPATIIKAPHLPGCKAIFVACTACQPRPGGKS